ncbi:Ribokinase [Streptomyces sp. enrichment culture]
MTDIVVPGGTNVDLVAGARTARAHGVRTLPTPAPARPLPPELLDTTGPLPPTRHEAAALTGPTDPRRAATALLERVPEAVLAPGAAGSPYAARSAGPPTVPAPRVAAVDSTGAGDTFAGALAVALGEGRPVREAPAWAAAAASLSVRRPGAPVPMPCRTGIESRYTS